MSKKELDKFNDIYKNIDAISDIICDIDFEVLKKDVNEDEIYRKCKDVNERMSEIGYWIQEIIYDLDEDENC